MKKDRRRDPFFYYIREDCRIAVAGQRELPGGGFFFAQGSRIFRVGNKIFLPVRCFFGGKEERRRGGSVV